MYEAKTLFTNIDAIVTAATTFLEALERVFSDGGAQQAIGDVCLTHVRSALGAKRGLTRQLRDLKTFDPYRTYLSKQDEAQKMFQDVLRKHSSFGAYIEVRGDVIRNGSDDSGRNTRPQVSEISV